MPLPAPPAATRPIRLAAASAGVLLGVLGAALGPVAPAGATEPGETLAQLRALEARGVREIIVRSEPGTRAEERAKSRASVGGTLVQRELLPGVDVLRIPEGRLDEAIVELRGRPDVRWAEANGRVRSTAADPQYLWAFSNDGRGVNGVRGLADADADVPEAWTAATGAGVTVAVVDGGVDGGHPDLAGQLTGNPGERGHGREGNGRDDDRNGFVDDAAGWDFVDRDPIPDDGQGHGTHVSGTVAAVRANGIGVAGVAPDARILALRVLDDEGAGWDSDVAAAFDYAGRLAVPVVNASLGGWGASPAEEEAIRRHPDTLYVVAAGNNGADVDFHAHSPCTIDLENVICVGATDNRDAMAGFSNFGATQVDLFAPGSAITSTMPGGGYAGMSGTSMAAPHVAGAAALVRAAHPHITAAQLRTAILDSADRLAGLAGRSASGGRLNAFRALQAVPALAPAGSDPVAPPALERQPVPTQQPAPAPDPQPATAPHPDAPADSAPVAGPDESPATDPALPLAPPPAGEPHTAPRVPSPLQRVTVVVRGHQVSARLLVRRAARVRVALRPRRAATARYRQLAAGATLVRLGRLRTGRYALEVTAGATRVTRSFTVR